MMKNNSKYWGSKGMQLAVLTAMLVLASHAVIAQAGKKPFSVRAEITGLTDGKAVLRSIDASQTYTDSTDVSGGIVFFKGEIAEPLLFGLQLPGRAYLSLFIEPGEQVSVKGDIKAPAAAAINGARGQAVWDEWKAGWSSITSHAGRLYKKLDSIGKDGDRSEVDEGFKDLQYRTDTLVGSIVRKYPSSPLSAFLISDRYISYPNPEKAEYYYKLLNAEAKNSSYGRELGTAIANNAKTAIGVEPEFTLPDRDGKQVRLSSLKGKVVLVDFWASWCGPCRKENPNIVEAYSKYHNKGFEVLGVSLDNNKSAWIKAIDTDGLNWLHVSDLKGWKSPLIESYAIKSIPTSFLLDKNGKIIAKNLRGKDLEKKLAEIFN